MRAETQLKRRHAPALEIIVPAPQIKKFDFNCSVTIIRIINTSQNIQSFNHDERSYAWFAKISKLSMSTLPDAGIRILELFSQM